MPRISLGIASFDVADQVDALLARAESALGYARKQGGGKAVSFSRGGHFVVSDFADVAPQRAATVQAWTRPTVVKPAPVDHERVVADALGGSREDRSALITAFLG